MTEQLTRSPTTCSPRSSAATSPPLNAMWSDDVTVWRLGGRTRDKRRAPKVLDWFVGATRDRRYELLDREVFEGGFVQQHVLACDHPCGWGNLAAGVHGGQSRGERSDHRIEEYFDPAELAPLSA